MLLKMTREEREVSTEHTPTAAGLIRVVNKMPPTGQISVLTFALQRITRAVITTKLMQRSRSIILSSSVGVHTDTGCVM